MTIEMIIERERLKSYAEGFAKGFAETYEGSEQERSEALARIGLRKQLPMFAIIIMSGLSEAEIRKMAVEERKQGNFIAIPDW